MSNPILPPAAVLVGGLGTRIRSVGGPTPKVLLPIEGRPFLLHLLDHIAAQGVRRVVLCLGYGAEAVWEAARTGAPEGVELIASHEDEPLGTGGAVRRALVHFEDTFFVLNGDTFLDGSLDALLECHRSHRALLTLSLTRSERAVEKGSVAVTPEGKVLSFDEKTEEGTGLINAGVYVFDSDVFRRVPEGPISLEREIIPDVLQAGGSVAARIVEGAFVDIGLPEDYMAVRDRLPGSEGGR